MAYTNAIYYLDLENGSDAARTQLTTCIASNPSGSITRIAKTAHGLVTGAVVSLSAFSAWLNGTWKITVVDADNFDLDDAVWETTADNNGTVGPQGGSSPADAWLTIGSGATGARIAPGDFIKIKKSPDPISLGSCDFTNDSATLTLPSASTLTVDRCEDAWTASANVTCTQESTIKNEGSYAAKAAVATAFTTGLVAYKNLASPLDLSGYTGITFWFRCSATRAAGYYSLVLDDTDGCVSPLETISFPGVYASLIPITLTFSDPSALTAIRSIGIVANTDPGTDQLIIDNIEACNSLSLQSIVGKNIEGDSFYPIKSIVGTTVILKSKYSGTTETATGYLRDATVIIPTTGSIQDSGSVGSLITYSGGWNFTSGLQDGITLVRPTVSSGYITASAERSYVKIEKFYGCLFNGSFINASASYPMKNFELDYVGAYGCLGSSSGHGFSLLTGSFNISNLETVGNELAGLNIESRQVGDETTMKNIVALGNGTDGIDIGRATTIYMENVKSYNNAAYGVYTNGRLIANTLHTKGNTTNGLKLSVYSVGGYGMPALQSCLFDCKIEDDMDMTELVFSKFEYLAYQNHGQVAGVNGRYYQYGTLVRDTSEARGGTGECAKLTPNNAAGKLYVHIGVVPVTASAERTVTVYLKKSADYNGNNPRIGLWMDGRLAKAMAACSVTTSYTQFSTVYTPTRTGVVELAIDCDGTVGSIYIDDIGYS